MSKERFLYIGYVKRNAWITLFVLAEEIPTGFSINYTSKF